jgi:hypothetical protein
MAASPKTGGALAIGYMISSAAPGLSYEQSGRRRSLGLSRRSN